MSKTALIIRHEFSQMVGKKAFIIFTFALPVVALLIISLFQAIAGLVAPTVPQELTIGYVDEVGIFNQYSGQQASRWSPTLPARKLPEPFSMARSRSTLWSPLTIFKQGGWSGTYFRKR